MVHTVCVAEYLFTRLHQLGIRAVHGVPGDFNLTLLDYIVPTGLNWVGNCNELNAAYAADGYSRIKGVGALITTFGVGELSAINAIAGAYTEFAPVVHIVGTPSRALQSKSTLIHHTLNDGNFRHFAEVYKHFTIAQANVVDPSQAAQLIDDVLQKCLDNSRPVYIEIPTDMVNESTVASSLDKPLQRSCCSSRTAVEDAVTDRVAQRIAEHIYRSKRPFLLVDGESIALQISDEVNELAKATGIPTSVTPFGKSIVDESIPNYHGVYSGDSGKLRYKDFVQACDLILSFGPHASDTNTYGFSTIPEPNITIAFKRDAIEFGDNLATGYSSAIEKVPPKAILTRLLAMLDHHRIPRYDPYPNLGSPHALVKNLPPPTLDLPLDQSTFYQRISGFFREGDFILAETGTAGHGSRDFALPRNTLLLGPNTWLSIGYMLPAAQGAAIAQHELIADGYKPKGRTILFEGDGSLQMTVQEISTIIRNKLDVVIFILNNSGYTIERFIHGMNAHYNDIASWRYLHAPIFFGADTEGPDKPQTYQAANWGQLMKILEIEELANGKGLRMVEVIMGKEDAPSTLLSKAKLYRKGV